MLYTNSMQENTQQLNFSCSQVYNIPDYAHLLITFFTSSLFRQDTIYTKNTKRNTEQWVEYVVRFYLFDKTKEQKRTTFLALKKIQQKVHDVMKCAFQFQELLQQNKTNVRIKKEKDIEKCWSQLYTNMSSIVAKRKGRKKKSKNTKKKHCV